MKTSSSRWILVATLAVLLALLALWLLRSTASKSSQQPDTALPPATAEPGKVTPPSEPAVSLPEAPPTQKPSKRLLQNFKTLNHNPIEFYGRAVDQFGEPVTAAAVEASVMVNTGTTGGVRKSRTSTDAQGYFSFTDLAGQDLTMVISKPGYAFSTRAKLFSYTYFEADHKRHIPDIKNPVVFVMWKKQGAEPLLHYDSTFWNVSANDSPIGIDLEKGKITTAAPDLLVRMIRDDGPSLVGGFGWSAQIEAPGGGLIIAPEADFYNLAPSEGYQRLIDISQPAVPNLDVRSSTGENLWHGYKEIMLWVKIRHGKQYGRVKLVLYPPNEKLPDGSFKPRSIAVEVWINPSGSRNLEYDRAQEIRPPR
ncbi:MAG: carboxypeptidase-like regulatory domain-containing protein [Lacunisphaera sp.]|nr:carboxypeptidase-like regulatory domain-containing protein [Lacunisphaera sp.]